MTVSAKYCYGEVMPSPRDTKALFTKRPPWFERDPSYAGPTTRAPLKWLTDLMAHQHARCAACATPIGLEHPDTGKSGDSWCVDVDTKTGEVLGLICTTCQLTISAARRRMGRLDACARYLDQRGAAGRETLPIARVRIHKRPPLPPAVTILADADRTPTEPDVVADQPDASV